jgi:hypothetical protein
MPTYCADKYPKMHFLGLLNSELHYFAGTQGRGNPPNPVYEPVRKSNVAAWTTRITRHCQSSNAGRVMMCNCSHTKYILSGPTDLLTSAKPRVVKIEYYYY